MPYATAFFIGASHFYQRLRAFGPENGAIVINEESIDLLLTLLNNGCLESPINHEIFDASVKKKVT